VMEFKGKATMSEVVPDERRVTLTGSGNDKSGGGSAKMDMKSQVLAKDGGGSEIVVMADVALAGKLVRFGRGMMEGISKQLFKQFAERVRTDLESEQAAAVEEAPPEEPQKEAPPEARGAAERAPEVEVEAPAKTTAVDKSSPEESKTEDEPAPAEAAPEPRADQATAQAASPPPEKTPERPEAAPAEKKAVSPEKSAVVPADNAPLDAGSLVWAAIWAWIKGLFARIFGKKG
jgi:hypothetical protein